MSQRDVARTLANQRQMPYGAQYNNPQLSAPIGGPNTPKQDLRCQQPYPITIGKGGKPGSRG